MDVLLGKVRPADFFPFSPVLYPSPMILGSPPQLIEEKVPPALRLIVNLHLKDTVENTPNTGFLFFGNIIINNYLKKLLNLWSVFLMRPESCSTLWD